MKEPERIKLLVKWQKAMSEIIGVPKQADIVSFLKLEGCYNLMNYRIFKKFVYTRYKREILTESEIKEWHQFYYQRKDGFNTGNPRGSTIKNMYTSIPKQCLI